MKNVFSKKALFSHLFNFAKFKNLYKNFNKNTKFHIRNLCKNQAKTSKRVGNNSKRRKKKPKPRIPKKQAGKSSRR